jgi:hypothetical protein
MQQDPLSFGTGNYAYANNSPANFVDPTGLINQEKACRNIVGTLIGGGLAYIFLFEGKIASIGSGFVSGFLGTDNNFNDLITLFCSPVDPRYLKRLRDETDATLNPDYDPTGVAPPSPRPPIPARLGY